MHLINVAQGLYHGQMSEVNTNMSQAHKKQNLCLLRF